MKFPKVLQLFDSDSEEVLIFKKFA